MAELLLLLRLGLLPCDGDVGKSRYDIRGVSELLRHLASRGGEEWFECCVDDPYGGFAFFEGDASDSGAVEGSARVHAGDLYSGTPSDDDLTSVTHSGLDMPGPSGPNQGNWHSLFEVASMVDSGAVEGRARADGAHTGDLYSGTHESDLDSGTSCGHVHDMPGLSSPNRGNWHSPCEVASMVGEMSDEEFLRYLDDCSSNGSNKRFKVGHGDGDGLEVRAGCDASQCPSWCTQVQGSQMDWKASSSSSSSSSRAMYTPPAI